MRYRSALLLFVFAGIAGAQGLSDEFKTVRGPLTILLQNGSAASPVVLTAMEHEVEALLSPSAILVDWQLREQANSAQVYDRLAVLKLDGHCVSDAPIPLSIRLAGGADALGKTYVVEGRVLPMADVRCDFVRKFIASELAGASEAERDQLLGRALGRVMAHELYHVLLRTEHHGRSGLARPAQSKNELIALRNSFSPQDERRLAQDDNSATDGSSVDAGR